MYCAIFSLFLRSESTVAFRAFSVITRSYSKSFGGSQLLKKTGAAKTGPVTEKVRLPAETDPNRLVNYVCGAKPYKEGERDILLKPDSEYPDWLWELRTDRAPLLHELEENSKAYWKKARKLAFKERQKLARFKLKRKK